jgi:hypothetical protein
VGRLNLRMLARARSFSLRVPKPTRRAARRGRATVLPLVCHVNAMVQRRNPLRGGATTAANDVSAPGARPPPLGAPGASWQRRRRLVSFRCEGRQTVRSPRMTEIVIAIFDTASAAEAAARNLEVARIPSAVVQRQIGEQADRPNNGDVQLWSRGASAWQRPLVTVAVDELHAAAVTGILQQYGPVDIRERLAQSHRR